MSKTALITGVTGQDGAFLSKYLTSLGYRVYGTYRRTSSPNFWRLKYLKMEQKIKLISCDVSDSQSVHKLLGDISPDEIYHMAAQSYVFASFNSPVSTFESIGVSTVNFLEAMKASCSKETKFYNAATSELYGNYSQSLLNENDHFEPRSPYAAAKLYSYHIAKIYRDAYDLKVFNGILFNHESEIRGLEFVTRKITNEVARIHLRISDKLKLGNITTKRDWGYAVDYVDAIYRIVQSEIPDDFVVSTGVSHSVSEFLEKAFGLVGLDWKDYVEIDKKFVRPLDVNHLVGDNSKIKDKTGWEPSTSFIELIKIMVNSDIQRWKDILNGKVVPTDALFYDETLFDIRSVSGTE